jgi:hypothetical protein
MAAVNGLLPIAVFGLNCTSQPQKMDHYLIGEPLFPPHGYLLGPYLLLSIVVVLL